MSDLWQIPATQIATGVKRRDFSALEVATATIARIETANPACNAIVQDCRAEALARAQQIDETIARGDDPGPMAGVPVTIKVNVDQKGFATTNGLRQQKALIAKTDSPVVANIRKAGGVIIGRTNTPAFSLRWFTNNDLHGQTLNPHNPALTPGGSSGGAAAAVAAGFCAIGHGTDIAGSIRYPAYACGVHGLRPSMGRVPTYNATGGDRYIGAQLMAVSGPIARSIDDIDLALQAMAAADPRDPAWTPAPRQGAPFPKRAALILEPEGAPVDARIKTALMQAAAALEADGWEITERPCPSLAEAAMINAQLWMAETGFAATDLMKAEGNADAQFVYKMMRQLAGPVDLDRVMRALQRRAGLMREWEQFSQDYPVLICPNSAELPFDQQSDVTSEADFERIYHAQLTQRALPVMGMPALSLATGAIDDRPLGVQLVAGRFREDILLAAGKVIEAASAPVKIAQLC